jgi:hypothetical protein
MSPKRWSHELYFSLDFGSSPEHGRAYVVLGRRTDVELVAESDVELNPAESGNSNEPALVWPDVAAARSRAVPLTRLAYQTTGDSFRLTMWPSLTLPPRYDHTL